MWLKGKKQLHSKTDEELLADYKRSADRTILGLLFDRYSHLVFGVCMKYLKNEEDAKDATLQIFEKLMGDLLKFEIKKFSFWLHSVSKNYCLMQLRNKKATYSLDGDPVHMSDSILNDESQLSREHSEHKETELQLLETAISNLNEEQRICIEMFYLKKMCYQDVSEISGFTMKQVKSHIQNGKRNIKIYMEKHRHEFTNT